MTIMEGLSLKGRPAEIPGCVRDDLPMFFKEMEYKVGAEIGVFRGEFIRKFCEVGLKMYAIDSWMATSDHLSRNPRYQKRINASYRVAVETLSSFDCKIIRKTSMDAVGDFEDGSLDFVYIDADHHFRHIADDLVEWTKKVKKGGVISGHDYRNTARCQVGCVVDAFVGAFLDNWYVLGEEHEEGRDRSRSYFWVKA